MPFGRIRQVKRGSNTSTTISVVLDKVPIAGNALIAFYFSGAASVNGVVSSGWDPAVVTMTNSGSGDEGKIHVKIAGSSESQTVTATPTSSDENMLIVYEVEGPFTSTSQVDIAYDGGVVGGTSTYTISAGTPSQAIEMAFAFAMLRTPDEYGLTTWTNGFHQYGNTVSSSAKTLIVAYKEINSTAALSTVATMFTSNTCMGGMITLKAHADVVAPPTAGDGYWTEIATPAAGRALEDVNPDPTNTADYKGSNGQESIIDAWNGAIIRQPAAGGILEYIIEASGGHGNYYGNEGYTLDLLAGTIAWAMHRSPTAATADLSLNDSDGVDALGNAIARHTYNYQCYDWDSDEFVFFGGNALAGGSASASSKVLRLQYGTNKTTWVTTGFADVPSFGGSEAAWHAWYIGDGEFIVVPGGGNGFAKYIKSSNSYVTSNTNGLIGSMPVDSCSLWDSKRGRMVLFGYHANEVTLLNPITGGAAEQVTTSVPGGITFTTDTIGGIYDSYLDLYVFWQGGEDLYFLNPVTWVWTTRSLSTQTVTPTAPATNGTYNRFAYISPTATYPEGAYIIVNGVDESTYLFFVAAAAGATGSLAVTLGGATLAATGTTTVVGSCAQTLAGVALAAQGTTTVVGASAVTLAGVTLAAQGTTTVLGTLATTLGGATLAASGAVGGDADGSLAVTLAGVTLAAQGTTTIAGTTSTTLGGVSLAGQGTTTIKGSLAATLGGAALEAYGISGEAPAVTAVHSRTGIGIGVGIGLCIAFFLVPRDF